MKLITIEEILTKVISKEVNKVQGFQTLILEMTQKTEKRVHIMKTNGVKVTRLNLIEMFKGKELTIITLYFEKEVN